MPHTQSHRNRNIRTYTNVSTGERYSGKVVEIQGKLYTTTSGVLEGDSQEVKASAPQRTQSNTITSRRMTNARNQLGMEANNYSDTPRGQGVTGPVGNGTMLMRSANNNPQTVQMGNPRGQGPIIRQFTARANTYYYDRQYNNPVPQGTPLHQHQNGDVMTEHVAAGSVMSDNSVIVFSASQQTGKTFRTGVDTTRNNPNGMMRTSMSSRRNYSTNISNRTSVRRGVGLSNTRSRMQRRRNTATTRRMGSGTMRRGGGSGGGRSGGY